MLRGNLEPREMPTPTIGAAVAASMIASRSSKCWSVE
jgi:hypothetical protein